MTDTNIQGWTPGPWRWKDEGGYSRLTGPNDEWICDDGSAGGEYGQQIDPFSADGKLIASAPEMAQEIARLTAQLNSQNTELIEKQKYILELERAVSESRRLLEDLIAKFEKAKATND